MATYKATPQTREGGADDRASTFRFVYDDEVENLPDLEWDVDQVLPRGGLVIIYGAPGTAKTFLGLDLAMAIASQREWHGHRVRLGSVVYLISEGRVGLKQRIRTLRAALGIRGRAGVAFLPQSIQLLALTESVMPMAAAIAELEAPPVAIFVDTLSRNIPGASENAQEDMTLLVHSCDYLRNRFGATVVLVHHARKGDDVLRGSTVLTGAADTIILLKREGNTVTVRCEKQKEAAEFEPITLRLTPVGESCLLVAGGEDSTAGLTKVQSIALQCLNEIATSEGCSMSAWSRSCTEDGKMSTRSFFSSKKVLLARGYVLQVYGGKRFAVSPDGAEVLQLQSNCKPAANAPPDSTATAAALLKKGSDCRPAAGQEHGDAWEGDGI